MSTAETASAEARAVFAAARGKGPLAILLAKLAAFCAIRLAALCAVDREALRASRELMATRNVPATD